MRAAFASSSDYYGYIGGIKGMRMSDTPALRRDNTNDASVGAWRQI